MKPLELLNSKFDVFQTFSTEEACIDYLIQKKWGGKPSCPNCNNSNRVYFVKSRTVFRCSTCNHHMYVKKNTIFENSNISLVKWFQLMFVVGTNKKGYSALSAQSDLGVSYKTAFYMLHKVRELMKFENEGRLNGIVEADEVFSGANLSKDNKLRYKVYMALQERIKWGLETKTEERNRKNREAKWEKKTGKKFNSPESKLDELLIQLPEQQRKIAEEEIYRNLQYPKYKYKRNIVGFLQIDEVIRAVDENGKKKKIEVKKYGKLRMDVCGQDDCDINEDSIELLMDKFLASSTILMTDGTGIYSKGAKRLKAHFQISHSKKKDEKHLPIKYSYEKENNLGIEYFTTNRIENIWVHFKSKVDKGTYCGYSYKRTPRYIYEFVFRYNSRGERLGFTFDKLFTECASKNFIIAKRVHKVSSKKKYNYSYA